MEFGSSLGGITLIAIAIIWLVFFIPSWTQRSEHIALEQTIKATKAEIPDSLAQRANRLQRTKTVFGLGFGLLFTASLASFIGIAASIGYLFLGFGLLALALLALKVSKAASAALTDMLEEIAESRMKSRAKKTRASTRSWTPNPLPEPLIKEPARTPAPQPAEQKSADVIEFSQKRKLKASELDEILARRRAI